MDDFESIKQYHEEIQTIQVQIIQYISNNCDNDIDFQELSNILNEKIIINCNKNKLKVILHLISNISENHHRNQFFFSKIEKILHFLREETINFFSNDEIFTIFRKSKRILLFLFQQEIIKPDSYMYTVLIRDEYKIRNYPAYFFNEFDTFFKGDMRKEIELKCENDKNTDLYSKRREIGENESYLCELIRNDSINEFITYINCENISMSSEVKPSIFESNSFLMKRKPRLIEYSAFFGSIQIFKYLMVSKADFTSSLWLYGIHSNNSELIHILEDMDIAQDDSIYYDCYKESIKCFNNDFAEYFENNYLTDKTENSHFLKYYNFEFFPKSYFLYDLCKYDHFIPVQIILNKIEYNLNKQNEKALLIIAAEKGNIEIVELLLQCTGIDINEKYVFEMLNGRKREETTALVSAIKNNFFEIAKLLLEFDDIDVNSKYVQKKHRIRVKTIERTCLFLAVSNENEEIVRILLNNDDIQVNKKSILHFRRRHEEKTALLKAIEIGNDKIVSLLLDHPEINVNICSFEDKLYCQSKTLKTALLLAIENGSIEIIKLLLQRQDIDVNFFSIIELNDKKDKITPLCFSVEKNNAEIVELLSKHPRIEINKKSKFHQKTRESVKKKISKTPLQIAVENNNLNIVNILLNCPETDVNLTTDTYTEAKNERKFIAYVIMMITAAILMIHSGANDSEVSGWFWQIILMLLMIISLIIFFLIRF